MGVYHDKGGSAAGCESQPCPCACSAYTCACRCRCCCTHLCMCCTSSSLAAMTSAGSAALLNMRSRWCAPCGITTAATLSLTLRSTPPALHGSMPPFENTMLEAPARSCRWLVGESVHVCVCACVCVSVCVCVCVSVSVSVCQLNPPPLQPRSCVLDQLCLRG